MKIIDHTNTQWKDLIQSKGLQHSLSVANRTVESSPHKCANFETPKGEELKENPLPEPINAWSFIKSSQL